MRITNAQHRKRMAERSLRQRERSKDASTAEIELNRSRNWVWCSSYAAAREYARDNFAIMQHLVVR